jgi:hypothetical protein
LAKSVLPISRVAEVLAEIALHKEESIMEDILREPVELSEFELDEVAGGGGESHCGCGCDRGPSFAIAVAVAAAVAIAL